MDQTRPTLTVLPEANKTRQCGGDTPAPGARGPGGPGARGPGRRKRSTGTKPRRRPSDVTCASQAALALRARWTTRRRGDGGAAVERSAKTCRDLPVRLGEARVLQLVGLGQPLMQGRLGQGCPAEGAQSDAVHVAVDSRQVLRADGQRPVQLPYQPVNGNRQVVEEERQVALAQDGSALLWAERRALRLMGPANMTRQSVCGKSSTSPMATNAVATPGRGGPTRDTAEGRSPRSRSARRTLPFPAGSDPAPERLGVSPARGSPTRRCGSPARPSPMRAPTPGWSPASAAWPASAFCGRGGRRSTSNDQGLPAPGAHAARCAPGPPRSRPRAGTGCLTIRHFGAIPKPES
ncbi:hypothetical protein QFZ43_006429 [Streptomyces afghaniensis]|nr:hypothetical protein [Streptomyces afghaniensis]